MRSLKEDQIEAHERTRHRYVSLAWQLWREQYEAGFFIRHPLPEERLAIEVRLFWEGQITHLSGVTDPIGQVAKWILDAIRGALSWLWNNLIQPGVNFIIGGLRSALEWLISGVRWVVDGIVGAVGQVWSWILSVGQSIYNIAMVILSQLAQGLAGLGAALSAGVSWIVGQVTQGIAGLGAAVSQGLSALGRELTKATSWIWQQLQGFFSSLGEVLKQIGTWIVAAIKQRVVDPLIGLLKPVFEGLKALITAVWNYITTGAIASSPIEWRGSYMRWLGVITGVGVMAVSGLIGVELVNLVHPFKDTKAGEIAKFAMQFSGIAFLQAAFFTTYFDVACAKPVRQELNAMFTPELPGSGDLIRFVVREVIEPDEFYLAMGLQGFSKYWSGAYWEAHWVLPAPERTRTAFLRKQIPEAEYRKFLIWYDFKPDPRPGISLSDVEIMLRTQYEWPGRIDTRWLIEWGIVDEAAGLELIKAGGMDPVWAPKVLEAYILNQLREELSKVRGVFERSLREGFLNPVGFAEKLTGIHYAPHVINALRRWADEELALAEKLELAGEYESMAKEAVWTVEQMGQELRKLGMVEERITRKQRHVKHLLDLKAAKEAAKAKAKR